MNIQKMHETFRTIGQQKGMQLIRAILPEEIDVYINDAIAEKTRAELIKSIDYSVKAYDNVLTSAMTNINLFKSLYRNARFELDIDKSNNLLKAYNANNGYHEIAIPTIDCSLKDTIELQQGEYFINPMLYISFSVEYDDISKGASTNGRIIPLDALDNTLNDYCNSASKEYPIITIIGDPFLDNNTESGSNLYDSSLQLYTNKKNCKANFINIKYIKKPNVVDYKNGIDCDLADYCHYEIVELAVRKFLISVNAINK